MKSEKFLNIIWSIVALLLVSNIVCAQTKSNRSYTIPQGALVEDQTIILKIKDGVKQHIQHQSIDVLSVNSISQVVGVLKVDKIEPGVYSQKPQSRSFGQQSKYLDGIYKLRLSANMNIEDAINNFLRYDNVVYAEPLFLESPLLVPDDPNIGLQDHLNVIRAFDAWTVTTGDPNMTIGIVDTGVQLDNVDLRDNIRTNDADPINGVDDDGNGYIDDYNGWDFADDDNDPTADFSGHGTRVAGVSSSSTNNNFGIAGVGFESMFVPLKIFRSTNGFSNNSYEAIIYAADQGYQVVNLSWGSFGTFSQFNQDVINYAALERDVVLVAAAGNTNEELDFYPASYEHVLSVGASDVNDLKAGFATYSYHIDLMAPGASVYSTSNGNGFSAQPGSSFSSPQVAGAAALVRTVFPEYNALQVAEQIRISTDDIYDIGNNDDYMGQLGRGRLNVFNAVTQTNAKSIRIDQFSYSDEFGQFAFFDDSVELELNFINYLNPTSDAIINVSSDSEYIVFDDETINLGALSELETSDSYNMEIYIDESTPPGERILFRLDILDDAYEDFQYFEIITEPDYLDVASENLILTLSSEGNLGYADDTLRNGGGFAYLGNEIAENLGIIIANHEDSVSDNVINSYEFFSQDNDFQTLQHIRYYGNSDADQYAFSTFNDENAGNSSLGLVIEQESMTWNESEDASLLVVEYRVSNNSVDAIQDLSFGMYVDWDLSDRTANSARWDDTGQFAYVVDSDETTYAGVSLLTSQNSTLHAIDLGSSNGNTTEVGVNFSDQLKFEFLTTEKLTAGAVDIGNNVALLLSAEIRTLESYESATVAYAMFVDSDLNNLRQISEQASSRYMEFSANPPVISVDTVCINENFVLNIPEGTNFEVFSDVQLTDLIFTGNNFPEVAFDQDTTLYVQNIDSGYATDVRRIIYRVSDSGPDFSADLDTLLIEDRGSGQIQFMDESDDAITWNWDFDNGLMSTLQNPKALFSDPGEYDVTLTITSSRGCTGVITKQILVAERSPTPDVSDMLVCQGEEVEISATNSNSLSLYLFENDQNPLLEGASINVGPITSDTVFYISSSEEIFESIRVPIAITVDPITAGFTFGPDTLDLSSDRLISFRDESIESAAYSWEVDSEIFSTDQHPTYEYLDETELSIKQMVTSSNNCQDSSIQIVQISESNTPEVEDLMICEYDDAIIAPSNGMVFYFYSDAANNNLIYKGTRLSLLSLNKDSTIHIVGADHLGLSEPVSVNVSIIPFTAAIVARPDTLILENGRTATFLTDQSDISEWQWSIAGRGFTETFPEPTFSFDTAGVYSINLISTSIDNCMDTTSFNYVVLDEVITAIKDLESDISVFPIPASEYLNVNIENRKIRELLIYDIMGNRVLTINTLAEKSQLVDVSHLNPGVYFIKSPDSAYTLSKFIVVNK